MFLVFQRMKGKLSELGSEKDKVGPLREASTKEGKGSTASLEDEHKEATSTLAKDKAIGPKKTQKMMEN